MLQRLHGALGEGDAPAAEAAWALILATLRPIGPQGRRQLADTLEAYADFKIRMGKDEEARRLMQRAASARKDPSELRFKQSKDEEHRWDKHPVLVAWDDGIDAERQARIEATRRELEDQLAAQERFWRFARIAAIVALAAFAAVALSAAPGPSGPLQLQEVERQGEVQVWASNTDPDSIRWAWIELSANDNAWPDSGLPRGFVLRPLDRRLLFTVRPRDPGRGFSYALRSRHGEGDPEREPDSRAVYLLPWAHGTKHSVSQGYFGRATHSGMHALDFDLPEGTPVHAARAGVVIKVKQDSDRGGRFSSDAEDGNVVQVMHDDASWAVYAHLRYRGAAVQKGQRVKAGELLGHSGDTGLASGPHLHFAVYRAGWDGPRTVPTLFQTSPDGAASLEDGRTYYAWHPGLPAFATQLGEALKHEDFAGQTRAASGGKFRLREERVDRRNIVWASNGTDRPVDLKVDLERARGARASVGLPHRTVVPARTEAFLFFVDFVGEGESAYRLAASYRPLAPER